MLPNNQNVPLENEKTPENVDFQKKDYQATVHEKSWKNLENNAGNTFSIQKIHLSTRISKS